MRIIILLLLVGTLQAQNYHTFNVPVSVGGATNASSLLTLNSTTQGLLIPRMTTAQRDAIPTPAIGLQIYNTETNTLNIFNGTWGSVGGGISGTIAAGQVAFGSASNTLSGSNNLFWNNANGQLGINLSPSATLHSKATSSISTVFRLQDVSDNVIWTVPNSRFSAATINTALTVDAGTSSAGRRFSFSGNNGTATKTDGMMALINSGDGAALYVQNLAGSQTDRGPFQVYQGSNPLITTQNNRFVGINTASPTGILHVQGSSTANTSLSFLTQNSSSTNTFSVGDAGRVTIYKDTEASATQSSARLMVESGDANTNLVLSPKGTGAFIVGPAPDGTGTGGNARGANAVDFQVSNRSSTQVASGANSFLGPTQVSIASGQYSGVIVGRQNQATALYSTVVSGAEHQANSAYSVVTGGSTNAIQSSSDWSNISGGRNNTITSSFYANIAGGVGGTINANGRFAAITGGAGSLAYLRNQRVHGHETFAVTGDAQTSDFRLSRQVVGFSNRVLSLSPSDTTNLPVLVAATGNTSRVWNARLQCVAVAPVQGTGGPAAGSVFSETMDITIKRIGTVTSIVNGTPMQSVSVSDIGMSGADFLVDADDTNEALRVRFQPPTIAAADTQIRAVCTVYLTEIGY